ncbi:protein YqbG [Desulforamulus aquiferis]|uniref:DUF3199 family protein n=1 Tax=Desulforamulus aquiferis TaxID=1397668 RepID=A0AAW7ZDK0_9FIRM|nr:DUF3199 family protein [Desulforamulus aquiferis]MDO7787131.1 DUF3199 family protein [Desulforamulus aquiferis]
MPLITAQQVKDYSVFEAVKGRPDALLGYDILQAETEVFQEVGHKFDSVEYPTLPQEVELALVKLTEYYALVNSDESIAKGYKSEKIGDYSYTLGDGTVVQKPAISSLLSAYIKSSPGSGKVNFRMRSI